MESLQFIQLALLVVLLGLLFLRDRKRPLNVGGFSTRLQRKLGLMTKRGKAKRTAQIMHHRRMMGR